MLTELFQKSQAKAKQGQNLLPPETIRMFYLSLSMTLALNLALDLDRIRPLNRAHALIRAKELERICNHSRTLTHTLVPNIESFFTSRVTQIFVDELHQTMLAKFSYRLEFTRKQTELLETYFYSAKLLLECLDLAYVTDRAAVRGRLFVV